MPLRTTAVTLLACLPSGLVAADDDGWPEPGIAEVTISEGDGAGSYTLPLVECSIDSILISGSTDPSVVPRFEYVGRRRGKGGSATVYVEAAEGSDTQRIEDALNSGALEGVLREIGEEVPSGLSVQMLAVRDARGTFDELSARRAAGTFEFRSAVGPGQISFRAHCKE